MNWTLKNLNLVLFASYYEENYKTSHNLGENIAKLLSDIRHRNI